MASGLPEEDIDWILQRKFLTEELAVPCKTLSQLLMASIADFLRDRGSRVDIAESPAVEATENYILTARRTT
jgi:hypothetical protein